MASGRDTDRHDLRNQRFRCLRSVRCRPTPKDRYTEPSQYLNPTYQDHGFAWCWSPDGGRLVFGLFDQESKFQGHEDGIKLGVDTAIPFSSYDVSIGDAAEDDEISGPRLVDPDYQAVRSRDEDDEDEEPPWGRYQADVLEWSDDGARLTALAGAEVYSVDVATGTIRVLRNVVPGRRLADLPTAISPDGRLLAIVAYTGLLVLDITVEPPVERLRHPLDVSDGRAQEWGSDKRAVAWDASGAQLAVLTGDGVLIFSVPSGVLRHRLNVVPRARAWDFGDACPAAFSSTGDRIAIVSNAEDASAGTVAVWHLGHQPRPLWTVPALPGICGVTFGDGDRSLVGWGRGSLQFWDAVTGRERNRYRQHTDLEEDDLVFHSDAGHPLAYPGGWGGDLFPSDPAFAVPDDGAFDRPDGPRWHWFTVFDNGLVVCPEPLRHLLWRSLSFVLDRRIAWPAQWADGTPLLEMHDAWSTAVRSARLPDRLPAELRDRLADASTTMD